MTDGVFRTTRWSVVNAAGSNTPARKAALEELCATYWYPLYALARRRGLAASDAEDAVQGFFADLLSRGDVERADPERGRFRSFLGAAFRNFLANERAMRSAQKRGGGAPLVSLDDAEDRYLAASGRALEPDALFDRAWALTVLDAAVATLRADYVERDQEERFDALRAFITTDGEDTARGEVAERLGLTRGALDVAVHRLRERYREALTASVRDTVESEAEVARELAALLGSLG